MGLMRLLAIGALATAPLITGCEAFREPLDAEALLGVWVVEGEGSARVLRDDRIGAIPDLQYEEHLRDATGWQLVRTGTWGLLSNETEVAGRPTIAGLQTDPPSVPADVFGREDLDRLEGIISVDGDVLVTITPWIEEPITSTRVEALPP